MKMFSGALMSRKNSISELQLIHNNQIRPNIRLHPNGNVHSSREGIHVQRTTLHVYTSNLTRNYIYDVNASILIRERDILIDIYLTNFVSVFP